MITQAINLNLIPGQVLPRVNVSQYDYGSRTLEFKLFNGNQSFTLTSSMTANISGTKADMHGFEYDATVDTTNQKIVADLTQQMTATAGDVTCELIIKKSGERLGTCNFVISVEKAALGDDIIISDTELPAIIAEATAQMEAAAQSASEAASSAQAAEESADKAETYGTHLPYIGANGNWFVYNVTTQQYEDSGVKAQGPLSGLTDVEISNPAENDIIAYDPTAQKWKNSSEFQTLTNQVKDMNNVLGAKNFVALNKSPYRAQVLTRVSVTNQTEDSVTIATSDALSYACLHLYYTLPAGQYIVCYDFESDDTSYQPSITMYASGGPSIIPGGSSIRNNEQRVVTVRETDEFLDIRLFITTADAAVRTGTFKNFMIRPESITDDTYVPYAMTNRELTGYADSMEVNGAVNMLANTATSQTIYGVTYTVNSDGSITVNGTATGGNASLVVNMTTYLKKGTYKLTGAPEGYNGITRLAINRGTPSSVFDNGNGATFTLTEDATNALYVQAIVWESKTVSNLTFKPMITVASYNGDYVPYAKSNKELTDEKLDISSLKTITAASSDFADFKTRIAAL